MKVTFKNFLLKPQVKSVLQGSLVIIIGALCSSLGSWDNINHAFWIKLIISIILLIIYGILLVFYSTNEVNERRIKSILTNQVKAFENIMAGTIAICKQSSNEVNTIIDNMIEERKINLKIWSFDKACTLVCSQIYALLSNLSGGNKDFGVAYVKLEEHNLKKEVRMNAFANQNEHKPSIYNKRRRIDLDDGRTYHDVDLFILGKSDMDILIGKNKIDEAFSYTSKESRKKNKDKYNQYIGIPVICNDTKMVGLLEIICLYDASLGTTEQEVKELASKYFVPYSYLILLLHKLEKALIAKPIEK